MKKIFNNTFLHRTLGISLCFTALFCLCVTNVYAQDEIEEEEEVVVKKTAKPKKEKTYEMKEATGFVVDDATGEPMGGVRVQALGLEKYSTLTDEDGSYKLSIPVFSDAVYVYAEGYNPLQVAVKEGVADANLIVENFNASFTDGTTIISQKTAYINESSGISVDQDIERQLSGDVRTILRNGIPGIGSYMTIRGVNSINANAQPLIILDGNMIDPECLSYSIYTDDDQIFTFDPAVYTYDDLTEPITEVPYWLYASGVDFHKGYVYFYRTNAEGFEPMFTRRIGVQAIYTVEEPTVEGAPAKAPVVNKSNIVYYELPTTAIETVKAELDVNAPVYNIMGQKMNAKSLPAVEGLRVRVYPLPLA